MKATAKAHTNIALIKYWGKRDEDLILPTNSSLSLTLDGFYTTTTVDFQEGLTRDVFHLNKEEVFGEAYNRVSHFLELIRNISGKQDLYAKVTSHNEVPTAAGFASSASGFAALAAAGSRAIGLDLSDEELSKLTRQGSGSACRSIYGGFVEWKMGENPDGSDSYAVQIAPSAHWDVRIAAVNLSSNMKKISSRAGMKRTVETSPFYDGWLESLPKDLAQIKEGIRDKDFEKIGEIAEANCLKMHATTLGANPPFTYWHDTTMSVMYVVQELRAKGIPAYFTIDAGPNVKVLYLPEDEAVIEKTLREIPNVTNVTLSKPGPGISYLGVE
ncbi:diphosphomevalonate decarboxylase [Oceanobacillus piezotolerans]|uniref:diphosphomevalonate decarboxylase n=1 Tax=Oceanobacillus piezotolerans TaxID=2448030 RepID=A0A498DE43_9BACI|nr:diphosphomevalonate decarboxylase [Oceanobacillus piezotolerans]RLL41355.1 diphosphomevalonate decarboxylase [Oceanobacillus piezotolerans]